MFSRAGLRAIHGWTHERPDLLFSHAAVLTREQFIARIPGFGAASIRDQLSHVIQCGQLWVRALQNIPPTHLVCETCATADQFRQAKERMAAETMAYLDRLSEAELNAELVTRPDGWSGTLRSPAFILHHVITHAFDPQGQIGAMQSG
jgi:uncharacterized damage-inducible protein DinB